MRTATKILMAGTALVAIPLVTALFVKKEYSVERVILIKKPKNEVYEFLKHLRNQEQYSIWDKKDPLMKKLYTGVDGTVGFVASWESENREVGQGSQTIINLVESERIETQLHFITPFESKSDAYMTMEDAGENHTLVRWGFSGKFPYPFNLIRLFFDMDATIGKDFEEGLNNLRTILEEK
jgi:hypothetical protein